MSELTRPDTAGRPYDGLDAPPAGAGQGAFHEIGAGAVPKTALFLSLAAFVVPLAGATIFDAGLLPWIAALIPAFLLSYYKRWAGSAAADPLTYAVIVVVIAGVAIVAMLLPAREATRVDPLRVLRSE